MVIFGGLELVAAGYLLHEHSKHKEERARLEEEEAAIERRRRRRRHSAERRRHHSHERKHSHSYEYEDAKPQRTSRPQYIAAPPTYPAASPYLTPAAQPARAYSAPPPQQQQQAQQDPSYPPTGWPAHWEQSQRPDPNVNPVRREAEPLPVKYGWRPDQEHLDPNTYSPAPAAASLSSPSSSSRRRSRGRSDTRPTDSPAQRPVVYNQQPLASPHVRFELPSGRSEPPPAYSR